ncbi:phage major capsid protein [Aureliella helgolandensis]|uniref:Mu-like prophage major head subunit gpT n=1 Tax=Aureliella helgolandensis TaxID=2527968 RepID=A0A518G4B2_9BACT|nr:hypothetical protein [Aureliella helgolandensis]QDV23437.1 hypothetical protein Q31a_17350 [Aureliella helgolandensis]
MSKRKSRRSRPAKSPTSIAVHPTPERLGHARRTHLRTLLQAAAPTVDGSCALLSSRRLTLTAEAVIHAAATEQDVGTFDLDAYSGGVMFPLLNGVNWNGPVVVNIAGLVANATLPVHRAHDPERPVGHGTVSLTDRIRVEGAFSIDNSDSREIRGGAARGFPWRTSIGMSHLQHEIIPEGQILHANGQEFVGPILHVMAGVLDEVSFVTIAGDNNTQPAIAASKNQSGVQVMNFSQWLAAKGWDEATLTDAQKSQLQAVFNAEVAAGADAAGEVSDDNGADADGADVDAGEGAGEVAGADADTADADADAALVAGRGGSSLTAGARQATGAQHTALLAQRREAAAEEDRIEGIRSITTKLGNLSIKAEGRADTTLRAHAIREGWSVDQTELYARRNRRPSGVGIHSSSPQQRGSLAALQAGILLRAGRNIDAVLPQNNATPEWMSLPVNDPGRQRIMNDAQAYRDLEMIDYVAQGLRAQGHSLPANHVGRSGRLATLQAGFSTGSTAVIFTQSIGAMAIDAYVESGDFSRGWTSEEDVPNLLETDRPRMQAAPDLTLHPTGDEADHAHRDATSEKVRADRYSRTAEIDENDFINDQFQLLRRTPREFGQAAARLRPNMVAAVLLANAALKDGIAVFHADHLNLSGSSALSQPNLQKVRAMLSRQKDGDASLNLQPTHLLTPTGLGDLAIQLTQSAVISNDSGAGSTNPIRTRNIMPIEESRLDNGVVDPLTGSTLAGSLTTWYLVSAEGHTIEVQFLEGTGRVPQVIVEQLGRGKFGLSITVKHFIGAKALDFRSMAKATA